MVLAEAGDLGDMVRIDGGRFTMGSDEFHPEEMPLRNVEVGPFWIDRHEVTNAQFAAFVEATGYVTVTERPAASVSGTYPNGAWFPGTTANIPTGDATPLATRSRRTPC